MAFEETTAATVAAETATSAQAQDGQAAASKDQQTELSSVIASLKSELVDMRREMRNKFSVRPEPQTQAHPQKTDAPATPAWGAEQILAFRDALDEAGVQVSPPQRRQLEKLYRADGVPQDSVAWVKQTMADMGIAARSAGQPPPGVDQSKSQPQVAKDQTQPVTIPAPAGASSKAFQISKDPRQLTQAQIDSMTPQEAREHFENFRRSTTGFVHPFAAAREAKARKSQDISELAAGLKKLVSQGK